MFDPEVEKGLTWSRVLDVQLDRATKNGSLTDLM